MVNSASMPASPSPTKTKKLSLQEYRKRIVPKAAETTVADKSEATVLKGVNGGDPSKQLAFLNVLAPSADAPAPSQVSPVESRGVR